MAIKYVSGMPALRKRVRKVYRQHVAGLSRGVLAAGRLILKRSNEIVPVDTGELKQSGYVTKLRTQYTTIIEVGYRAEWAVEVHEETWKAHGEDYNVKYATQIAIGATYYIYRRGSVIERVYHERKPEEQAKFLETAVRANLDDISDIIRAYTQISVL